jgi:hypothetical protein
VVLTRMDAVTVKAREGWLSSYREFGSDHTVWDNDQGRLTEKNRNEQFRRERNKYSQEKNDNDDGATVLEESEYGGAVEDVLFVDAKRGQGTHAISRAVYRAGRHVNERRRRRGLNDRPLRVGIIGFPNVGKVGVMCDVVCF